MMSSTRLQSELTTLERELQVQQERVERESNDVGQLRDQKEKVEVTRQEKSDVSMK